MDFFSSFLREINRYKVQYQLKIEEDAIATSLDRIDIYAHNERPKPSLMAFLSIFMEEQGRAERQPKMCIFGGWWRGW